MITLSDIRVIDNINDSLSNRFKQFGINIYDENGELRPLWSLIVEAREIYDDLEELDKEKLGKCFMGHYYNRYSFDEYMGYKHT